MGSIKTIQKINKQGQKVLVRTATLADGPRIRDLATETFKNADTNITTPEEFSETSDEDIKSWLNDLITKPNNLLLVAEIDGVVVGSLDFHQIGKRKRLEGRIVNEVQMAPGKFVDGIQMYQLV